MPIMSIARYFPGSRVGVLVYYVSGFVFYARLALKYEYSPVFNQYGSCAA